MENFKQKFVEEANEHINDLEKALLELEKDASNISLIEQIFRAMHSLKGGGAMFGFEKISEFTHNLENIYDFVRNGKVEVNKELLNLTLVSVDHIKLLLDNEENGLDETILENHENILGQFNALLQEITDNRIDINPITKDIKAPHETGLSTFYIHFVPHSDIFNNGTNPLYLIDEVVSLGQSIVLPNIQNIPPLEKLIPHKCYVSWEIVLSGNIELEVIKDVFIFVESECFLEIEKISDSDLIDNKKFAAYISDFVKTGKEIGLNELKGNIGNFDKPVSGRVKKMIQNNRISAKDNNISSIRVASEKLDSLMNLVSELVTTQARLHMFSEMEGNAELNSISENVQKLSKQLRDITFSIVLIPIETMITRFQRLVRDLSNGLKKEIKFVAQGTDTELDKTIIENLTDPLLHLLRNSIDHGIETPEERLKKGKPAEGTILFKAFYSGANVHIQIIDDGAGIDPDFIRNKAISKGLISADAAMSKAEILDLIFFPGFSTAKIVTDVSGRGVGMDVVRKKISSIRGDVEVNSEMEEGTTVTIKLPLTLSIIDGLLVKIENTFYVVPLAVVEKIYAIEHAKIVNSYNNLVVLDGAQYPFINLRKEFWINEFEGKEEQIIIIKYNDKSIGITVDEVVGEYQAVLKPLGKHYKNQEIISGATILGDGTIALVIDTNKAIKYFTDKKVNVEV
jgi:two-component system, chemotaxis family, sensor kinase CheA